MAKKWSKITFEVGKLYRYIGGLSGLDLFTTKVAASWTRSGTSSSELVRPLYRYENFLVIAVEQFKPDDDEDTDWDYEFIRIMSSESLGWLNIGLSYQTSLHFEEVNQHTAAKEIKLIEEKQQKTLGGLGQFDSTFLVKTKVPPRC